MDAGRIIAAVKDIVSLELSVGNGTYIRYMVEWGDGTISSKSFDQQEEAQAAQFAHNFSSSGVYQLKASVLNDNFNMSQGFAVEVSKCAMPPVMLSGSKLKDAPIEVTRKDEFTVQASYHFKNIQCEKLIKPNINFTQWEIWKDSELVDVSNDSSRIFTFKARDYIPGDYNISWNAYWSISGKDLNKVRSTTYIRVIKTELRAVIADGDERYLGIHLKLPDGNLTYYNFTLDASGSYDPDDSEKGVEGLNLTWTCRIVSDEITINKSRSALTNMTKMPEDCNSPVSSAFKYAKVMGGHKELLQLSTVRFLENVEYEVKVVVSKDDRLTTAVQRIKFMLGEPPMMSIT